MRFLITLMLSMLLFSGIAQAQEEQAVDGSLVHFELPTLDFQQSMDFYGGLFGWTFTPMDANMGTEGEPIYVMFETPGGEGGGFTKDFAPGKGGGLFYIYAADVPAKLAEVVAAGGTVAMDTFPIPDYGWIAIFTDPHGNKVGLFSSANVPTPEEAMAAHEALGADGA